jgi:hypothetical protein
VRVLPQSQPPEAEIRTTLEWFLDVAPDRGALERRIKRAQQHYRDGCTPDGLVWPETSRLVLGEDLIASCLAQGVSALEDRRSYDEVLGGLIVPFLASIGAQIELLRRRPGAAERVQRMLHPTQEHPAAGLHELAAAARYAREDFEVNFIAQSSLRSGDLAIRIAEIPRAMQVECRQLRRSGYELRERAMVQRQFALLAQLIHARALSLDIDVRFDVGLTRVPQSYLADRILAALATPASLSQDHRWRDEFGEGVVRAAALERMVGAIRNAPLFAGAPMARSLSARTVSEDAFLIAMRARPGAQDPRHVAEVDYASVLTWHCVAPESLGARAARLRWELADIDRQLANADVGIVHVGMAGECDAITADQRRRDNLGAVRAFNPRSRIAELHLHYHGSDVDEAVDRHSRWHRFLLEDARLLAPGTPAR